MKSELCQAFCNDIQVTAVPAGLAISTVFKRGDGDKVGFYVIENDDGSITLEDDGATIPSLESEGVDFETETRRKALEELLGKVDAFYDSDDPTIRTRPFHKDELANRALEFVSVMLRMEDFLLLTRENVASSFREDAALRITKKIAGKATIRENEPVSEKLSETIPDMVIEAEDRPPVAIFFGNTANRVHEAIFLYQNANYEVHEDVSVIALLESDNSVSQELRRRASNRLATVPVFKHDENAAVERIVKEVLGRSAA